MLNPEVLALRRKPIGDNALDLLLRLEDEKLFVLTARWTAPQQYQGQAENITIELVDNAALKHIEKDILQANTVIRKKSVMHALQRRGFVSSEPIQEFLARVLEENPSAEIQMKIERFKRWVWQIMVEGYSTDCWKISEAGKQALKDMSTRVTQFKSQAFLKPRYLITARLNSNDEKTDGVMGIYKIIKENRENIFVSRDRIDNVPVWNNDRAVKTLITGGKHVGDYVSRENVAFIAVEPEDFVYLSGLTKQFSVEKLDIKSKASELVRKVEKESELKISFLRKELEDKLLRFKANKLEEGLQEENNCFVLKLDEDDLESGFKI